MEVLNHVRHFAKNLETLNTNFFFSSRNIEIPDDFAFVKKKMSLGLRKSRLLEGHDPKNEFHPHSYFRANQARQQQ